MKLEKNTFSSEELFHSLHLNNNASISFQAGAKDIVTAALEFFESNFWHINSCFVNNSIKRKWEPWQIGKMKQRPSDKQTPNNNSYLLMFKEIYRVAYDKNMLLLVNKTIKKHWK